MDLELESPWIGRCVLPVRLILSDPIGYASAIYVFTHKSRPLSYMRGAFLLAYGYGIPRTNRIFPYEYRIPIYSPRLPCSGPYAPSTQCRKPPTGRRIPYVPSYWICGIQRGDVWNFLDIVGIQVRFPTRSDTVRRTRAYVLPNG